VRIVVVVPWAAITALENKEAVVVAVGVEALVFSVYRSSDAVWESDVVVTTYAVGEDRTCVATFKAVRFIVDGAVACYG